MRIGRVLSGRGCLCMLVLGGVALAGCASHQTSASPTGSTVAKANPPVSPRQAGKRYFRAMAPVIAQDYKADKDATAAIAHWKSEMESPAASWSTVQDLASIVMRLEPRERQILSEYQAITPPPQFRAAHAALVADNSAGLALMGVLIHDIDTERPPLQWASEVPGDLRNAGTLDKRVVRDYRRAAAKLHLQAPAKLLKVYSS